MSPQPTNGLRFVERAEEVPVPGSDPELSRVVNRRVLQQMWTDTYGRCWWQDVPLGVEEPATQAKG